MILNILQDMGLDMDIRKISGVCIQKSISSDFALVIRSAVNPRYICNKCYSNSAVTLIEQSVKK